MLGEVPSLEEDGSFPLFSLSSLPTLSVPKISSIDLGDSVILFSKLFLSSLFSSFTPSLSVEVVEVVEVATSFT